MWFLDSSFAFIEGDNSAKSSDDRIERVDFYHFRLFWVLYLHDKSCPIVVI